jgi:hypothetical protein
LKQRGYVIFAVLHFCLPSLLMAGIMEVLFMINKPALVGRDFILVSPGLSGCFPWRSKEGYS